MEKLTLYFFSLLLKLPSLLGEVHALLLLGGVLHLGDPTALPSTMNLAVCVVSEVKIIVHQS